jgi:hypothetical protein
MEIIDMRFLLIILIVIYSSKVTEVSEPMEGLADSTITITGVN